MKLCQLTASVLLLCAASTSVRGAVVCNEEWSDSTVTLPAVSVTGIKNVGAATQQLQTSVTVIDEKQIERDDILNLKTATELVPNFYIPDYGSRMTSSIYVRGLGARIDQPVVGLNVDNIPYLNKDNYDFDLADIDRIEVYRGPQSTKYGRNTMGGLINLYTLSPLRYQGVRAMLQYGLENTVNASVSAYHRWNAGWGSSLSVSYGHTDGFFRNEYNGKKTDKENQLSVRMKHAFNAGGIRGENVTSVNVSRQGGYPYQSIESGKIAYNDTCYYKRLGVADGLTLRHRFGESGVNLSSISSFQYINDDMTLDQDFLPISYFTLTQKRHEWAFTQDFVVSRRKEQGLSWLGGLFGFYKRTNMSAPVTFKDDGIKGLIEDHFNRPEIRYPIRWDDRTFVLASDFLIPDRGAALYGSASYSLNHFTVTADLRLDYEKVGIDYHNYTSTSYTRWNSTVEPWEVFSHEKVNLDERGSLSQHFLQLLPKVTLDYSFDKRQVNRVYFTVSKGYKAGGYNTQMFSDVLQQALMAELGLASIYNPEEIISYKPESSWNYELGGWFDIAEAHLSGNASMFYIDCRNQQLTMFPEGTTTGRIMTNAGKTRSYGMELSLKWTPVKNLEISGAYGHTNAKFVKFNNGKIDYKGKHVPYAPSNTLYAGVDYTLDLRGSAKLLFHAATRGVGDIYWDEANSVRQNFYLLPEASVTYETPKYSVQLWGENLTSTRYDVFYFVSVGNAFLQRGKPRTVGATLRLKI
ncbi:MAG: TonB-dependent receptor [Muribaculaceae bacterium]|nr:TonB-dependent receptor [Muribaculaceae bacterium]